MSNNNASFLLTKNDSFSQPNQLNEDETNIKISNPSHNENTEQMSLEEAARMKRWLFFNF